MSEKIPVKLCFKKIEKLQREKFYGTLEIKFEKGEIVHLIRHQHLKKQDLE